MDINAELQILADEEKIERIQEQYDEMLNLIWSEYNARMYEANAYDEDCIAYGV